jgi:hypothetical protein
MTIPIVPGPFSFLSTAGEAAGALGQELHARKREAQQIAQLGMTSILSQILNGIRPASYLDDPVVRKMSKVAFGFELPSGILPQPQETIAGLAEKRLEGVKPESPQAEAITKIPGEETAKLLLEQMREPGRLAAARAKSGVPEKTAEREAAEAKLGAEEAGARISAGLPQLQAEADAAAAQATAAGHEFKKDLYIGVRQVLGKDPAFARLAYEAAAGILDRRTAMLQLIKTAEADRTRLMIETLKTATEFHQLNQKQYEQRYQSWLFNRSAKDDANSRARFEAENPPPTAEESIREWLQSMKISPEEFAENLRKGLNLLPEPATATHTEEIVRLKERLSQQSPETTAAMIQRAVSSGQSEKEIFDQLSQVLDPDALEKVKKAYQKLKASRP